MKPQVPITLATRRIYDGERISLRLDTIQVGNRPPVERPFAEHPGSVVLVPITDRDTVLLIRQWRHAVGRALLELPAGTLNPGEEPEATAHRELREEAGHSAQRLFRLGGFWATSGWCNEYAHVYLATGLLPDPLPQDDVEDIHVVETALADVPDLIRSGEITDQFAVAALLTALYLYPNQLPAMAGRN